ncbi:hypothetical protein ACFLT1_07910 [Bacteroidota bacterium]
MSEKKRKYLAVVLIGLILVSIPVTSLIIGPEELVNRIGLEQGYLLVFIVSFFAGYSAFTAVSFYTLIISFIAGGLHPLALGIIAGLSVSLGDLLMYYFWRRGRELISGKMDQRINRLSAWFQIKQRSKWIPYLSFIYFSIIPLPNDWLLLFLASIRFPRNKVLLIILLGDLVHVMLLTQLASKGIQLFG